jgi:hypothetical protein
MLPKLQTEDASVFIVLKMIDDRWAMYDRFSDKGAHFVEWKMHRYGADGRTRPQDAKDGKKES